MLSQNRHSSVGSRAPRKRSVASSLDALFPLVHQETLNALLVLCVDQPDHLVSPKKLCAGCQRGWACNQCTQRVPLPPDPPLGWPDPAAADCATPGRVADGTLPCVPEQDSGRRFITLGLGVTATKPRPAHCVSGLLPPL